jgi:hypothetical protein
MLLQVHICRLVALVTMFIAVGGNVTNTQLASANTCSWRPNMCVSSLAILVSIVQC